MRVEIINLPQVRPSAVLTSDGLVYWGLTPQQQPGSYRGLVYWGLTPQQQPGSYQGGEILTSEVSQQSLGCKHVSMV